MNESTVILTGVQINTPIYLGMKREYDFVHPIVDEFCRAAEFVPTPGEAPLHLVAGKGPFQRTVSLDTLTLREQVKLCGRVDEVVVLVEVDWLKKLNVTPKESQVS